MSLGHLNLRVFARKRQYIKYIDISPHSSDEEDEKRPNVYKLLTLSNQLYFYIIYQMIVSIGNSIHLADKFHVYDQNVTTEGEKMA